MAELIKIQDDSPIGGAGKPEVEQLAPESGSSQPQDVKMAQYRSASNELKQEEIAARKEVESHNYLQKRLRIYNMFRGNEVSKPNSPGSVPAQLSPHRSEPNSD